MPRLAMLVVLGLGLACAPGDTDGAGAGAPPEARVAATELAFGSQPDGGDLVDPQRDGWDTEVLSAAASDQLGRIAEWVAARAIQEGALETVVSPDFASPPLVPPRTEVRFGDGLINVRRAIWSDESRQIAHRGVAGLRTALERQIDRLEDLGGGHAKLKLFRIEVETESFTTRSLFEVSGHGAERERQINSVWTTRWTLPAVASGALPLLLDVEVSDYEETDLTLGGGPLFEDVTVAAIGHNRSYGEQVTKGAEHWLSRLTKGHGFSKDGWHGVSIADVNGDGLEDIFLPEQGGLPNRLFVQNAIGTFDERSADAGVDFLERSLAGLFVDLDNDGDQDLVLSHRPAGLILANDGEGRYEVRFVAGAVPDSHSVVAADYDNDGDLDIYLTAYRRAPDERGLTSPVPYHDANNGGRNALLRNDGGFQFTDVTVETGLDTNNRRFSLAAAWEDFDNDGDADLYVANDYGRNNLYRNDGGTFTDIAAGAGVEDVSSGMSVTWADYDNDGLMDIYVGNMFSAAGNRITYQRKFEQDRQRAGPLEDVQRMARGNSLFRNVGRGQFIDRSVEETVNMGRWAWSSLFADVNNDGWEDLVVANGNLTQSNPDDL